MPCATLHKVASIPTNGEEYRTSQFGKAFEGMQDQQTVGPDDPDAAA